MQVDARREGGGNGDAASSRAGIRFNAVAFCLVYSVRNRAVAVYCPEVVDDNTCCLDGIARVRPCLFTPVELDNDFRLLPFWIHSVVCLLLTTASCQG